MGVTNSPKEARHRVCVVVFVTGEYGFLYTSMVRSISCLLMEINKRSWMKFSMCG